MIGLILMGVGAFVLGVLASFVGCMVMATRYFTHNVNGSRDIVQKHLDEVKAEKAAIAAAKGMK